MTDDDGRRRFLLEEMQGLLALPRSAHPQDVEGCIRTYFALSNETRRYRPRPYPWRITLFLSEWGRDNASDPLLGWGALAPGRVEVAPVIPGDHFGIVTYPSVTVLAKRVGEVLAGLAH